MRGQETGHAPNPLLATSLATLVRDVRAAGVEPIFVLMPPHWNDDVLAFDAEHAHDLPTLFAYRDPGRYPGFYRLDNFYNFNHLGTAGSMLLTEQLASDFALHLERAP